MTSRPTILLLLSGTVVAFALAYWVASGEPAVVHVIQPNGDTIDWAVP